MEQNYEVKTIKLNNGNEITYKIVNGTAYHIDTPQKVVDILENARKNRERIRLFYGDKETGKDWHEEYDTIGYIGKSCGEIKIPLLIKNSRSMGGGAILDHCIVKITKDKKILYQHKNYNLGKLTIKPTQDKLKDTGYTDSVFDEERNIANFKSILKANKYIRFLKGEVNSKA